MTRSVVVVGATGAVGGHAARALVTRVARAGGHLTVLGRRPAGIAGAREHLVDPLDPSAVAPHLPGHAAAVCALGLGQPSKVPRAEFLRVDRDGVLAFARACRAAGVGHFVLLGAIDADARSRNWYLRGKGELEDGLVALEFPRLTLVRPSVILTPEARFGALDALAQRVVPWTHPLLAGPLRKYRGIPVDTLGRALAACPFTAGTGVERLEGDAIVARGAPDVA